MAVNQNKYPQANTLTDYDAPYIASEHDNGHNINFQMMAMMMLRNWYWFVICIVISISIAAIKLARTTPQYAREAKMLIKEDNSQLQGSINDFMPGRKKVNVDNETRALRNSNLMREVVIRLALNDSYWAKEGLHDMDIYKNTPVQIMTRDAKGDNPFSMNIRVEKNGDVKIWDFETPDESYSDEITAKLGQTVNLPNGQKVTLLKPSHQSSKYLNTTINFRHEDLSDVTERYVTKMSVFLDSQQTTVVRIVERGPNTEKLDDVLNTIMAVYNEQWLEDKNKMAVATSKFIDERLGVIEQELGNVDSDISTYKSENLVPDVEAAGAMSMQEGNANEQAIFELSNQIGMARLMRQELVKGGINEILPATSGISNPAIQQMMNDFNQKVLERNRLLSTSSERNPIVTDLTNELKPMHKNIIHSLDTYISTLNTQMGNAETRANNNLSKIAASPKQAKYLLSVERQQKVKESLYLYLLQKREENQLGKAFTPYNTRIIQDPGRSEEPSEPDKTKTLTIALAIGFLVPLVVLYLQTFFDNKIRNKKDLKNLSAPYLGEIPNSTEVKSITKLKRQLSRHPERVHHEIVVDQHSRDAINEAFRVVRTNLEFMIEAESPHKESGHIIALTSANPGSGKTFITLNLAAVISIKKHKVCVLDLDLRRGSLSKYLGSPRPGITDYLIGNASLDQIIRRDIRGFNGFDAIAIGSVPPNPAELLATKKLSTLIEDLEKEYDYILLDCPPVEIVTDALIINRLADRTLFIVRAGLLHKDMIEEIDQFYRTERYRNITVLLNGTDRYGGYGYNRYGYKYNTRGHYGYGEDSDKEN